MLKFRTGNTDDLDEICTLLHAAVENMIQHGILQWDEFYPTREIVQQDIINNELRVGMIGERIAVIYSLNDEYDEGYKNGDWQYTDKPFGVIHRLCVHPDFQNQGVAGQTLAHIEEEFTAMGIHSIRLDAFTQNPYALRLYDSFGFKTVGFVDFRKGRFHLMEKKLRA